MSFVDTQQTPEKAGGFRLSSNFSRSEYAWFRTRWGDGSRNSPKTVAKGDTDLAGDIADINAGRANQLQNGDIVAPSGRVYGTHPGRTGIFPRSGSLGTVDLTQAKFSLFQDMITSGGLVGNALRAFEGMLASGNPGLSPASRQKLID
ncbi:MAG: hypothetical protein ACK5UD_16365, partial [Planctomyces sp.]